MTGCVQDCPFEGASQDERSAGPIADDEIICRAAYAPMHYKGDKIKSSVIKAADLFNGELSVWRASVQTGLSVVDVAAIVADQGPAGNLVQDLFGVPASQIRGLRDPESDSRLFCLVDETETDSEGGFHSAHAHIRLCEGHSATMAGTDNAVFQLAKESLIRKLKEPASKVWSAAA